MNTSSIRRAIAALVLLVVVMLVVLAVSFFALRQASDRLELAQHDRIDAYRLAMELRQNSGDLTRMARSAVATGLVDYERQYNAVLDIQAGRAALPEDYYQVYWDLVDPQSPDRPRKDSHVVASLRERMERAGFPAEELALVEEALRHSDALTRLEVTAINMARGRYLDKNGSYARVDIPNQAKALELLYSNEYTRAKAQVMQPLEQFFALMDTRVEAAGEAAHTELSRAQLIFLTAMILTFIFVALLVYFDRRLAAAELLEKEQGQKRAEEENDNLNNSIISVLQVVSQISQRDLTVKAPVTQDVIGVVSDSINALTDETARVLHDVVGIAGEVKEASEQVKQQSDLVAQLAARERRNAGHMVESLLDATQTMNQVTALAEQSNLSAEQATEATDNALNTVTDTVTGMESIRETIAETEKRIKRLGERSQEISGIVSLINSIAERTHVLALNASMQAAVAGEAGRGFAVVAEEVQRLAESSRSATQQIVTLVGNIQIETNETINAVNRTIGQVVEGSEQAQKAGEQMRRTQEITAQLVTNVRSIAQVSEQQKALSAGLLQAVQQMGDSTEQASIQLEVQNEQTNALLLASRKLVESVGVFRLPAQTDSAG